MRFGCEVGLAGHLAHCARRRRGGQARRSTGDRFENWERSNAARCKGPSKPVLAED